MKLAWLRPLSTLGMRVAMSVTSPLRTLDHVVEIATWKRDEDFEYHPIGSKPKRNVICPADCAHPFMIPGHTYLFKVASGYQAGQMWSEALAYQMGVAAGLRVPPCFIAIDSSTGEVGALIEFFLAYPGEEQPDRLVHGVDLLQYRGFTTGSDRPHGAKTNIELLLDLGIADAPEWWARLLAFDALIGNTDRHTENWGILFDAQNLIRMAPIFDNGSSFGHILGEPKISKTIGPALEAFIERGRHHCGWDADDDEPQQHIQLCGRLANAYVGTGTIMQSVIQEAAGAAPPATEACLRLSVDPIFTVERSQFVLALIGRRSVQLKDTLRG